MTVVKNFLSGICAGIMVSIGGCVFLACENRVVGAVLFSVALLCICFQGYSLFTGKVGFMPAKHGKAEFSVLLWGLAGNFVATCIVGAVMKYAIPSFVATAQTLCSAKLEQEWLQTLIRAIFCGMLMYLAVNIYRENKSIAGILFCVPVFILSGFEHSIADMFYFAASDVRSLSGALFLLIVIVGNAIGGMLLPVLSMVGKKAE